VIMRPAVHEPTWHHYPSPYYNDTHHALRDKIRAFVDQEILPFVHKWDEQGKYPADLRHKAYAAGIYGALWPKQYGGTPACDKMDHFHSLIWHDELARAGSGGLMASCFLPLGWALLPILKYGIGDKAKQSAVCRACIRGEKTIALAVTEPMAGSDVGNIGCCAVDDADEPDRYYRINGEKYFISNGYNADYITLAIRDGNKSKSEREKFTSLSFILIDVHQINGGDAATMGRIYKSKMKTQGWWLGNTTYLVFKNVRVPKSHIIGEANKGFVPILENFNHGRFAMASTAIRYARCCLEDSMQFAQKRETFGRKLSEHQVIRHKLVDMMRRIERAQNLMEQITFQMDNGISSRKLAPQMAMIKIEAAKCMEFCAREASQIFGGRSYLRGGSAARVERIYREVCVMGIAEGATEILTDFIARQAKL